MTTEAAMRFENEGPFTCLALIKPHSELARAWKLDKPGYCIFEYSPAVGNVQIRWGDGSWQELNTNKELEDLVLLRQFDEQAVSDLFD